jgi:predicted transcriptional regulator
MCYKHFNIFLRSEKTDFAMARTDQFLEDCFSQYEGIQTDSLDSSNVEIFCFRQLLEYVIENFTNTFLTVYTFVTNATF